MIERGCLGDPRLWAMVLAVLLLLSSFVAPRWPLRQPVYSTLFVIDITRSMNVADYRAAGEPVTRLARAKAAVAGAIARLPCGSNAGLALFTERTVNITLMPIEVCAHFNSLQASLELIDWRMAWAADSNVNRALVDGMAKLRTLRGAYGIDDTTSLVFLTDGQEAPPVNPRYEPDPALLVPGKKEGEPGAPPADSAPLYGLIVGVGGYTPVPIPKYSPEGERIGVYAEDDVPQAANFGQPANPEAIEGYVPRNAPWGRADKHGSEHLSSVREPHLQAIAAKAGFDYIHLDDDTAMYRAVTPRAWAAIRTRPTDIRWLLAVIALALATLVPLATLVADLHRYRNLLRSNQTNARSA
ncbi:VWA domain-containing protein [Salinisphaera sp. T31B1]|uniref:VWA domain-containing protein n=1 Tax=Salinisphaera sp. T31B1 TaxID=727963 RepID=UPI0033428F2C